MEAPGGDSAILLPPDLLPLLLQGKVTGQWMGPAFGFLASVPMDGQLELRLFVMLNPGESTNWV